MKYMLIGLSFLTLTFDAFALSGEDIFERHSTAILQLKAITPDGKSFDIGTGFFIKENGLILTNRHVMEFFRETDIYKQNKIGGFTIKKNEYIDIQYKGEHTFADVALLKVDKIQKGDTFLNLSKTSPKTGEDVFLIGNPEYQNFRITNGILSFIGSYLKEGAQNLQYTAPTLPGSSGSPVINREGYVIGIHSHGYIEKKVVGIDSRTGELKSDKVYEQGYNAGWDKIYLEEMLSNYSELKSLAKEEPSEIVNLETSKSVEPKNDLASLIRELKAYTPPSEVRLGSK